MCAQDRTKIHPSFGVYDLMDPASALYFAQFILGLQPYFSSVKEYIKNPETKDFCWRLDHTNCDHSSLQHEPPSEKDAKIEKWLGGLLSAENPE